MVNTVSLGHNPDSENPLLKPWPIVPSTVQGRHPLCWTPHPKNAPLSVASSLCFLWHLLVFPFQVQKVVFNFQPDLFSFGDVSHFARPDPLKTRICVGSMCSSLGLKKIKMLFFFFFFGTEIFENSPGQGAVVAQFWVDRRQGGGRILPLCLYLQQFARRRGEQLLFLRNWERKWWCSFTDNGWSAIT